MKFTKNEQARLEALKSYSILDTPEEQEFGALVKLATHICGTPISQINFLDTDRQWNKASFPPTPKEMKRGETFCSETIHRDEWMIVEDASSDQRFSDLPYVKNDPNIKFYAGVNLKSEQGYNIGTICVLGFESKELEDWQLESLKTLAQEVEARLELRKSQSQLKKKAENLEEQTTFLENAADLTFLLDAQDYRVISINPKVDQVLGYSSDRVTGKPFHNFTDSDQLKKDLDSWLESSGEVFSGEYKLMNRNGKPVWLEVYMTQKKEELYATARDITRRKLQEEKIKESLEEKNILLSEIHHRVKNNMAVISSMIQLQQLEEKDQQLKQKLNDSISRIQTMGTIHEMLYQSQNFSRIDGHKNIKRLVSQIIKTQGAEDKWDIQFELEEISLNINQAIPVSLILNEALTNLCKRASVEGDKERLWVSLKETGQTIHLQITSGSNETPVKTPASNEGSSLSMQLIASLSKQLKAECDFNPAAGKSNLKLSFQKADIKGFNNALQD